MTFDKSPPPPKTSPLEDDDLVKKEAIKVSEKKPLGNDVEDEVLENDEIVNIKESKSHPLENVIRNLNKELLDLKLKTKVFFCFLSTIEPKNVGEALKDKFMEWCPNLDNVIYDIVDRVMHLLALVQERRPSKDHGIKKGHHSTSSSSTFLHGLSSYEFDDDK
uniref:Reverse transcriptase domain-containing protein n=1 Tax=Tanacetum cinerariifolium TaxID=118510 RepID=A0A6L2K7B6_TANCI|nr:hypothetical protein [Tanacetum cinerariifolium]